MIGWVWGLPGNSCPGDLGLQRVDFSSSGISNWLHVPQPATVAHIWRWWHTVFIRVKRTRSERSERESIQGVGGRETDQWERVYISSQVTSFLKSTIVTLHVDVWLVFHLKETQTIWNIMWTAVPVVCSFLVFFFFIFRVTLFEVWNTSIAAN